MFDLDPLLQLALAFAFCVALMSVLWLIQRQTHNAGIVDIGWAAAIGLQGLFFCVAGDGYVGRRVVAAVLIAGWSLRLSVYLAARIVGEPEEGRYARLRSDWGPDADRRFFGFYMMQAAAAFGFSIPVFLAAQNQLPGFRWTDVAGVVLWLVGFGGLALADWQLARFRQDPANRGKTCRAGLWRYSRHPNYFFEWVHWWAYVGLAVGADYWWLSILVPMALLYFVLFVTGIPPTEAQAVASRGDDYRRYQQTTNAFIPWFPKKV
jgi:steroid 5-alpha reductase family enzyme